LLAKATASASEMLGAGQHLDPEPLARQPGLGHRGDRVMVGDREHPDAGGRAAATSPAGASLATTVDLPAPDRPVSHSTNPV
jgi:hypothetical protein